MTIQKTKSATENAKAAILLIGSLVVGLALRYCLLDYQTFDTSYYQMPWYEQARLHGWDAIGISFTNYTPFYTYLLVAASRFAGLAEALYLAKSISFFFEFGSAILASLITARCGANRLPQCWAFAVVWCAPTVLVNGAAWGQTDAVWTFFIVGALYLFIQDRPKFALIAFGAGLSFKAQAVFLGPFVLGLALARKFHWAWLSLIPLTYALLLMPAWMKGVSAYDLATVYLKQAYTFDKLSKNAANLWALVPDTYYAGGTLVGLCLAIAAGLAIALGIARQNGPNSPKAFLIMAAGALLLMPFLLPKMHDRYFYGFEIVILILACVDRRFVVYAVAAQFSALLAYSVFTEFGAPVNLAIGIVINCLMVFWFVRHELLGSLKEVAGSPFRAPLAKVGNQTP